MGLLPLTMILYDKDDHDEGNNDRYGDECCEGKCSLLHFVVVLILAGADHLFLSEAEFFYFHLFCFHFHFSQV